MYIEFLGPPGAGKSAIHADLTDSSKWYNPEPKIASRRRFLDSVGVKYRIMYRALSSSQRSSFDAAFLTSHFHREALAKFANQHPDSIQCLAAGIGSVKHQPAQIFSQIMDIIERYQIGFDTVREDEQLCIDECFTLGAVAILWRKPSDEFSLDKYLQQTPTPDALIHVDAPPGVCLERQRQRNDIGIPDVGMDEDIYEQQSDFQDLCTTVFEKQRSRTNVLYVENTDSIEDAVEHVESYLSELSN